MLTLLDHILLRELAVECGRLLLLSAAAAYVGANVRRLAARHGWDNHLLHAAHRLAQARRWLRRLTLGGRRHHGADPAGAVTPQVGPEAGAEPPRATAAS